MTYNDLLALTQAPENNTLGFKGTTRQLERDMEALCAFLNAKMGTILFDVTEKGEVKEQVTDQVGNQVPTKSSTNNKQIESILRTIGDKTLSVKEIMQNLSLTHRPTFRTNYLHPAIDVGLVESIFPNQPNHPKQKYRLTEKGKSFLTDISTL